MKALRFILIAMAAGVFATNSHSQEVKARSSGISFDFTPAEAELVWLEPAPGSDEVESKKMQIKIGVKHNVAIDKVAILHNGLRVSENYTFRRGASDDPGFIEIIEHIIPMVDGDNEILVAIRDVNGNEIESKRNFVLIEEGLAAVRNRKNYALLFATNEYDDPVFSKLKNPVNDARDIAQVLRNKYGFEVDLVENPTQDTVMLKIREYIERDYDPYDQLFIFFAGHGVYDETFKEGFLVCKDTEYDDPSRKTYITHKVLSDRIDNIPNQHIFLTLDACFSGTFDPAFGRHKGIEEDKMYADVSRLTLISRKLELKTRRFITSGGKEYVPDGRPGMNSPFAARFLEALRSDGGRDGIVTISDIITYVELVNPQPRYGAFGTNQSPSEFVFEKKN
ncbi:MAG: caspase family protein [Bacteroidetes bacterium]|nr:caspase family protein [Bacteroidota bacterium]